MTNIHADKSQESKSHAAANSHAKQQGRSGPAGASQKALQKMADNSPGAKQLKAYQQMANDRLQGNGAVAQRKVIVDDVSGKMTGDDKAVVNGETITVDDKGKEWITDGYAREYASVKEFKDHVGGSPVDVGLAKKLGKWYRIGFFSSKTFFVLGENHGAFGYRELIAESNQEGKVLGEGGSNALLSATKTSDLAFSGGGLKDKDGISTETIMENITAKAYFGLTVLKAAYVKAQAAAVAAPVVAPVKLPEKQWLTAYQSADPDKRKQGTGLNKIPYFLNSSNKKVFANFGTKAEEYNTTDTANKIIGNFEKGVSAYTGAVSRELTDAGAAILELKRIQTATPNDYAALLDAMNVLLPAMNLLAISEAKKLKDGADPSTDLAERKTEIEKDEGQKKWSPEQKEAMAHRDFVMLQSVLKAKDDHIMAGMGDHHAKNLKGELAKKSIRVITFDEFTGNVYSSDAIAPHEDKVEEEA